MFVTKAFDVEVLPNFFSITIIDIVSYLNTFSDCYIEEKGRKIDVPLIQVLSVEEIKKRLDLVECDQFYITPEDDSQLLKLVAYFGELRKREIGVHLRHDWYGYNINNYDNLMVAAFLMKAIHSTSTKRLLKELYQISKIIIETQDKYEIAKNDPVLQAVRRYKLPYTSVDVMKVFALNKVGTMFDKDTNKKIYIPKSLKQTSINLQWYKLLEYEMPNIGVEDAHFYRNDDRYRGYSIENLNRVIETWDRFILPEYIPDMMIYNKNDVFIVCEMVRLYKEEFKIRYGISKSYKVDVMSSSRSGIADILFDKFYSDISGLHSSQWKGNTTEREVIKFKDVIFDFIKFESPHLQEFLEKAKKKRIYSVGKESFSEVVTINNLSYSIATGGIHSKDNPAVYYSNWSENEDVFPSTGEIPYKYIHFDITSYYPSIIVNYNLAPEHLKQEAFVNLVSWLKDTRVAAKHSKEEYVDGIHKSILAEALKIVINSIYGKLGFIGGDICDTLALVKTTINGELMILMLCEQLELNNIEVISANTDGIVIKLYKNKIEVYNKIVDDWKKLTKFDGDSEDYQTYVTRDINNYFCQELNGHITFKGAMNPKMYLANLAKGYNSPIVAKAVVEFFLNNTPILETLYKCDNILDFCKTQNIGRQFHIEETIDTSEGTIIRKSQRACRYYISINGGVLEKVHNITAHRSRLCAGQKATLLNDVDDKHISTRGISYQYYYNECMNIINPIKLGISPSQKADPIKKIKSGKAVIKKYGGCFNTLFD